MEYELFWVPAVARPWQIVSPDDRTVFTFVEDDKSYAQHVLARLNNPELIEADDVDSDILFAS